MSYSMPQSDIVQSGYTVIENSEYCKNNLNCNYKISHVPGDINVKIIVQLEPWIIL